MQKQGAAKEYSYSGAIGLVAFAVFVEIVGYVALRVAQRPVSTLGIGVAIEATIACDADAAERDREPILARLEELRIDGVAEPIDARTLRLRLARDPGPELLRALLARGELAMGEVVDAHPRRGTAQSLQETATRAPDGTRALLSCERDRDDCEALFVRTPPAIRASDVDGAQLVLDAATGEPRVSIALTHDAARQFAEVTRAIVGRRLAISYDDRVLSAPVVQEPIVGGMAAISGVSEEEARAISIALSTRPLDCGWRIESMGAP